MIWADRISTRIQDERTPRNGETFVIRDEKTISGRVHIGSMRGVAVHGLIGEVLTERGVKNEYHYELNDFDPFDSIPGYLDEAQFSPYLGKPLYSVPSPEPGFKNYAEYFADEFISVHKKAGFTPTYYRATELYTSGRMDTLIKQALEHATDIRRILEEVSGSKKDSHWLPISVVCEACGKVMTTRAYDYDGETVAYACERNPEGVTSCGHTGRVAPWGGAAKLFWKVEWAAKWIVMGVDIEGGGKDHSTKGGSRDVANAISREIFNAEPPFDIPYEFFLVGGKKMSSSKGRGSSAKEISDLFPSELLRLVLIGKDIREQIDVDPQGESVPRMYDWYDELAESVRQGSSDDHSRLFALSALPQERADFPLVWEMRFREVAFIVQMPHLVLAEEATQSKGMPLSEEETQALEERALYAKFWLATYAPEIFKYELKNTLPTVVLSDTQMSSLKALLQFMEGGIRSGEELHAKLHEMKTEIPIQPKALFEAIYQIFLGRESGPKAGWFLAGLPREFVLERLKEATA